MASGAPRGHITTGIFSTDKVYVISKHSKIKHTVNYVPCVAPGAYDQKYIFVIHVVLKFVKSDISNLS